MTSLTSLVLPHKIVNIDETQSLTLHGLSAVDIAALAKDHLPDMVVVFGAIAKLDASGEGADQDQIDSVLKLAFDRCPALVAAAITLSTGVSWDDEDFAAAKEVAAKLDLSVQIECLLSMVELTLRSEAEVKKLMGMLTDAMTSATNVIST